MTRSKNKNQRKKTFPKTTHKTRKDSKTRPKEASLRQHERTLFRHANVSPYKLARRPNAKKIIKKIKKKKNYDFLKTQQSSSQPNKTKREIPQTKSTTEERLGQKQGKRKLFKDQPKPGQRYGKTNGKKKNKERKSNFFKKPRKPLSIRSLLRKGYKFVVVRDSGAHNDLLEKRHQRSVQIAQKRAPNRPFEPMKVYSADQPASKKSMNLKRSVEMYVDKQDKDSVISRKVNLQRNHHQKLRRTHAMRTTPRTLPLFAQSTGTTTRTTPPQTSTRKTFSTTNKPPFFQKPGINLKNKPDHEPPEATTKPAYTKGEQRLVKRLRASLSSNPEMLISSATEGVDIISRNSHSLMLLDSPSALYLSHNKPCVFVSGPLLFSTHHYSLVLGPHLSNELVEKINHSIGEMKKSGFIKTTYQKWWKNKCGRTEVDRFKQSGYRNNTKKKNKFDTAAQRKGHRGRYNEALNDSTSDFYFNERMNMNKHNYYEAIKKQKARKTNRNLLGLDGKQKFEFKADNFSSSHDHSLLSRGWERGADMSFYGPFVHNDAYDTQLDVRPNYHPYGKTINSGTKKGKVVRNSCIPLFFGILNYFHFLILARFFTYCFVS